MASSKVFRWGILSSGKIAQDFTQVLVSIPNAKVVAVGSRSQASADSFAKRFNIPAAYDSYEKLVQDKNVDIIYIASPHSEHYAHMKLSLNNNKHVLCEKAFTLNKSEALEVKELAKARGLFLMEAMWSRFLPFASFIRSEIDSGRLGSIHLVTADFGIDFPSEATRIFTPQLGGGCLLDVGIYPISIAKFIFQNQPVTQVLALGHLLPTGVDGHVGILLKFGENQLANLSTSAIVHSQRQLVIAGSKGKIIIKGEPYWHNTTSLQIYSSPDDYVGRTVKFESPNIAGPFNYNGSENMLYEALEVQRCIENGKTESEIMKVAESVELMDIMDQVRKQLGVVYPTEKKD